MLRLRPGTLPYVNEKYQQKYVLPLMYNVYHFLPKSVNT